MTTTTASTSRRRQGSDRLVEHDQPDASVAEAFGLVRERRDGRVYLDFGRYGKVYSAKGAPFQNQTQARHVLSAIRTLVATGIPKQRAIDRWRPRRRTALTAGSRAGFA